MLAQDTTPLRRKRRLPSFLLIALLTTVIAGAGTLIAARNVVDKVPRVAGVSDVLSPSSGNIENYLLVGSDSRALGDPNTGETGDVTGNRSDTIMVMRVDPATRQAAVLSFPRDLWVKIPGRAKSRINSAYIKDDPTLLSQTLFDNFGIIIDHYIQVDFCAFKRIVDAVGGVTVPFSTRVLDKNVGLDVAAGCHTFSGDEALAYVRSRHLKWMDEGGKTHEDGTSDLGRISRQQDFLRRTVARLLDKGAFDPDVAGGIIDTVSEYIVTDPSLTPRKMLEFAGVMSKVDPTQITTYQIEARNKTIQGNAVLIPELDGDNMQAIIAVFQGKATLTDAPDQVFETTTTIQPAAAVPAETSSNSVIGATTSPTSSTVPVTTLPGVIAEENVIGVVPDANVSC